MSNFDTAIERVLGHEAGYVNNPEDPGGETKWGISKRTYPNLNIKDLTREQAIALYRRDFWTVLHLDDQPLGIASQVLDFGVNSGGGTAMRALQRAIGVADDGHIGPVTLAAVKATEPHDLIMLFLAERLIFMSNCQNWQNAGKGWARRVAFQLRFGAADA